jgi:hypothetical protein
MTTRLTRSMPWSSGLVVLALVAMSGPGVHAEPGVICGQPTKSGNVTMNVVVKRPGDLRATTVAVTLAVDSTWSAEDKATAFWVAFAATKADTVLPSHSIATVGFVGQNGWTVIGTGMANDGSQEPDQIVSSAGPADQEALCSLSGRASGYAADGSPGSFRVTISGRTVVLSTFPGMAAEVLEQQLIGRLNGMGVQARFATEADFADGLETLPHDESVVWMKPSDMTGFEEELNDTGLLMQLAMLLDTRPVAATNVSVRPPGSGVELSARPSVFSGGSVQMRYSLGHGGRYGEISVFDATGRRLWRREVGQGTVEAATGVLSWDGRDDRATSVPNGVYFVRLMSGPVVAMTRVVRVR